MGDPVVNIEKYHLVLFLVIIELKKWERLLDARENKVKNDFDRLDICYYSFKNFK